jgi:hypothetical protein
MKLPLTAHFYVSPECTNRICDILGAGDTVWGQHWSRGLIHHFQLAPSSNSDSIPLQQGKQHYCLAVSVPDAIVWSFLSRWRNCCSGTSHHWTLPLANPRLCLDLGSHFFPWGFTANIVYTYFLPYIDLSNVGWGIPLAKLLIIYLCVLYTNIPYSERVYCFLFSCLFVLMETTIKFT